MNKHKKLGRLATAISIVRWIGLIVLVGGAAYLLFARARLIWHFGGGFTVSTLTMVLSFAAVLVVAFLIWLGVEVVVQVLRHFMRMEKIALYGPAALDRSYQDPAPVYGPVPQPPVPPAEYSPPVPEPPQGIGNSQ
ncbi:MAG TPA: hypothetical protein PK646_00575 [Bacillota bacterium]|jgi:hypothetical protein|nr:hypothetical protein [Fastidiosipila sp.]HPX92683.1 hypothetical protein [Bacillota bacterium]HQB80580.1 hypothetical protein [Bacillota bacterium]